MVDWPARCVVKHTPIMLIDSDASLTGRAGFALCSATVPGFRLRYMSTAPPRSSVTDVVSFRVGWSFSSYSVLRSFAAQQLNLRSDHK